MSALEKKEVLVVILDRFADYEYPYLATALQDRIQDRTSDYVVKTVSTEKKPVRSIGGFTVVPDYSLEDCPDTYAALVLIGGYAWRSHEAEPVARLVDAAMERGAVVGAICDATVFLGKYGHLNSRKHTSNTLDSLREGAGDNYSGEASYIEEQAVRDGNLITANGSAGLEFAREMLLALEAYPTAYIEGHYRFFKHGYIEAQKEQQL